VVKPSSRHRQQASAFSSGGGAGRRFPARRLPGPRAYELRARRSLSRFRQATLLAVALAAFLLILLQPADQVPGLLAKQPFVSVSEPGAAQTAEKSRAEEIGPETAAEEAAETVRDLMIGTYALWPKIAIAMVIFLLAWVLARTVKFLLRHLLRNWTRAEALGAFAGVVIFLLALGAALSVIAGDVRALVGSVGLVGLALSWALQAPIESFTGWLLNSFKGYYQVGDRIAVGEVFGDVYKIDILTTTVWESGGPDKPVQGAQPTGAMITFPNSEVLRNNIVNYTRDFPYVWDEIVIGLANESDLGYALQVLDRTAQQVVGTAMAEAAEEYRRLLETKGLLFEIAVRPQVYFTPAESWVNAIIRYVVAARERRQWASELFLAVSAEMARPEHQGRMMVALPRMRLEHSSAAADRR
jgi:small conductance mechanosensitive channel